MNISPTEATFLNLRDSGTENCAFGGKRVNGAQNCEAYSMVLPRTALSQEFELDIFQ